MGRHREWRKLVKKLRRKRKRTEIAIKKAEYEKFEQKKLESSPTYIKMLKEQEYLEQFHLAEEERLAKERELQWLKTEEEAQKQWKNVQEKLAKIMDERLKEEERILQEWKREQQKIVEEKERRRKLKKENEMKLEVINKKIEEFINNGGNIPDELNVSIETHPTKEQCPFFQKTSACRFKDICSRNHIRPGVSQVLLFTNFYSHFSLQQTRESEYGSDMTLEYDDRETYNHFREFFFDVISEFKKYGRLKQFKVCRNTEVHLRGNVYVEYSTIREALKAYKIFNGRWYAGKQIHVEFSNITSWKAAICGMSFGNKCPKGSLCNFLHVFKNPGNMFREADQDLHQRRTPMSFHEDDINDSYYNGRYWRWSESPERRANNTNEKENYRKRRIDYNKKTYYRDEYKRNYYKRKYKSRSRSKSPTSSHRKRKRKDRSRS